ncbi:MAG: hypothetical protein LQ338_000948 [Usnochroma carphineum]|nr:MAG: hypothetical protein LQ338_000948 [Usnochroma carphineum]
MPDHLSHEKRLRVVRLFLNKWQAKDIAREIGCSCSTIYHIKENLLNYGTVYKPQLKTVGRPTKVPESGKEAVKAFVQEHPEAQQKDVRLFLSTLGVEVHQATISRIMKELKTGEKYRDPKRTPRKDEAQAGPPPAGQTITRQPPPIQLPTDRPLCGRPDCKGFKPQSGQTSTGQVSAGQPAPDPAPTHQVSSVPAPPSQATPPQLPSAQLPPLQAPYYAHPEPRAAEPVQQQPEHALEVLAEATEHHSEPASRTS